MKIRPFKAFRPTASEARAVASLPYDVGSLESARKDAGQNLKSFLHVERPEVDLPDAYPLGCDHESASRALQEFMRNKWLVQDAEPHVYLYREQIGAHVQRGIMACCSVDDYWADVIKKHEKTKKPVEDQRTQHVLACDANTGPIFLLYKDREDISAYVAEIEKTPVQIDFTSADGVRHQVWIAKDSARLVDLFKSVPCAYIADGHHRAASAGRAGLEKKSKNPSHDGSEEYNWFMASLFPASELKVLAYNRSVKDLNGLDAVAFLDQVRKIFTVRENTTPEPAAPGQVSMYLGGTWYGLSWMADPFADPVSALDVSVLQTRLLAPVLGIDDPRTNSRIDYAGGWDNVKELQQRVDTGKAAVAFSMHPVTVDQLMAISDAGQIMPPKSTWFEPKLRSGLFVHALS